MYEKTPYTVTPEAHGRGVRGGGGGGPVTFTAKSMTLFTATSARSSAIFLPLPRSVVSLRLWIQTSRPPPFCACAPRGHPVNCCGARLRPDKGPIGARRGGEGVCQEDSDQWRTDSGERGGT